MKTHPATLVHGPQIVSGFPGVGKSFATKELSLAGYRVSDSDSSGFDKAMFPQNYIAHIQDLLDSKVPFDYIFVSSHEVARAALREAGIEYTLVYPSVQMKDRFADRYKRRGSPPAFLSLMEEKWTDFIESCATDPQERHIVLDRATPTLLDAVKKFLVKL